MVCVEKQKIKKHLYDGQRMYANLLPAYTHTKKTGLFETVLVI